MSKNTEKKTHSAITCKIETKGRLHNRQLQCDFWILSGVFGEPGFVLLLVSLTWPPHLSEPLSSCRAPRRPSASPEFRCKCSVCQRKERKGNHLEHTVILLNKNEAYTPVCERRHASLVMFHLVDHCSLSSKYTSFV